MTDKTTATAYMIIRATRGRSWQDYKVIETKVVRLTQNKPTHLQGDEIVVKVRVNVPSDAFEPFQAPIVEMEYTKPELTVAIEG